MPDISNLPSSLCRVAGDFVFVSGKMGLDEQKRVVPGGMAAQTTKALNNIEEILASVGLTRADIVKATIFITDRNLFDEFNEAYRAFFGDGPTPSRATLVTSLVVEGGLVEIQTIAYNKSV